MPQGTSAVVMVMIWPASTGTRVSPVWRGQPSSPYSTGRRTVTSRPHVSTNTLQHEQRGEGRGRHREGGMENATLQVLQQGVRPGCLRLQHCRLGPASHLHRRRVRFMASARLVSDWAWYSLVPLGACQAEGLKGDRRCETRV